MVVKFEDKASRLDLCKWAEVAKSSFHYKQHPGPRGIKASTHTPIGDGLVTNEQVVDQIRAVLVMDYCVYGYQVMTKELQSMEYIINKKKSLPPDEAEQFAVWQKNYNTGQTCICKVPPDKCPNAYGISMP